MSRYHRFAWSLAFAALPLLERASSGQDPEAATYLQEVSRPTAAVQGLESFEVLSVASGWRGALHAGTSAGLVSESEGGFAPVEAFAGSPVKLVAAGGGHVLFTHGGALHRIDVASGRAARAAPLPAGMERPEDLHALLAAEEVHLAGARGLFVLEGGALVPAAELHALLGQDRSVRAVAAGPSGELAVAAASGLFRRRAGAWEALTPREGPRSWAVLDARAVAYDAAGRLWFACPQGAGSLDRESSSWRLLTGAEGLPYADFTCMAAAPDGSVWLGTRRGAIRFDGRVWEYRQGRRWLPHDLVNGTVVLEDGTACFATPGGLGRIERVPLTLAEKARFFEEEIDARHRRTPYGFVLEVALERPGDRSRWTRHDSDNDGLWTSMYGAGECFAYAATGDRAAKRRAREAFWALRFLGTVTQGGVHPAPPGFAARTVLPTDGPDPNAGRLERDRREKEQDDSLWKIIDPRWPRSADGKWYWKCDTSSDELDGHYFFYAQYHDLVAESEVEKEEVRRVVAAITDHIIEHGYNLVDHDGKPTRWARYSPAELNQDPRWFRERGLNSLSILSYLKVAEHMTGDAKYARAARELIEEHSYHSNALYPKLQAGPGTGNQSDDEMAFMSYYDLLKYEKDPRLRAAYARSFHGYWRLERPELSPLFNFLYAGVCRGEKWTDAFGPQDLSPDGPWLEESLDALRRFPLDRCDWRLENSHRLDVVRFQDLTGERRGAHRGYRRDGRVLPIDERHVVHWSHDPWELDQGGGGRELADGASFLLPYYLGLHHGFLKEAAPARDGARPRRKPPVLGVSGSRFTLDGEPVFLAGISYYGALGAGIETVCRDLDEIERLGLNWIRVWATWSASGADASAVTAEGEPRARELERLRWLVSECGERGMVVDVTLSRGDGASGSPRLGAREAHARAVETLVVALKDQRNWYLDLSNERNIRDRRFASIEDLKALRELARRLDPERLVTASHGGDLSAGDVRDYILEAGLDFLTPHRPRGPGTAAETAAETRKALREIEALGRAAPVHHQEPFRRGYSRDWEPSAEDFAADLRGALDGGAAGWCFHNGDERRAPDRQPRRSFDLREKRLFEQLDREELKALEEVGRVLKAGRR
ncbi:MAG: hypothetical protein HY721_11955 [Planctomycetes bacterium]|nr:hypothetical protein [Planctomycetota bacterium]